MCGIFGYIGEEPAAEITALGLFMLQHRGQEACGIAVSDGRRLKLIKELGYVKEVFYQERLKELDGFAAIGHVRYPTRGTPTVENAQPHLITTLQGPLYAFASNGDVVNYRTLREKYEKRGVFFLSDNDGELLGRMLVYKMEKEEKDPIQAVLELMQEVKGAYSALFLTPTRIYAFRDPWGFRPMVFGKTEKGYAVASESVAMDIIRAQEWREVEPAELLIISKEGVEGVKFNEEELRGGRRRAHCSFEIIYFARPDSYQYRQFVHDKRILLGEKLAEKDHVEADAVVPVPDSSNFMALGYSRKRGIPLCFGLIRSHYVGRTFIKPTQSIRDESVRQKFNPLYKFFSGKRVILVDDSIVRGTTIRKIVRMVRGAGAKEVHVRIASPPVRFPCRYGIDTPTYEELIANKMSIEKIREFIEADSLLYLTVEELREVLDFPEDFCYACFTGEYPVLEGK